MDVVVRMQHFETLSRRPNSFAQFCFTVFRRTRILSSQQLGLKLSCGSAFTKWRPIWIGFTLAGRFPREESVGGVKQQGRSSSRRAGVRRRYLRPVRGCINAGCVAGAAVATAGLGLLTFVLLLANSSRIVCGMSGSNRTPCCEQPRVVRRSDIMPRIHLASEPRNPANAITLQQWLVTWSNEHVKGISMQVALNWIN